MSLVVLDASVLAAFYSATDSRRARAATRLAVGDALFAPGHVDAEVVSALRGISRGNAGLTSAVPAALTHLTGLPLRRMPIAPLLARIWELRDNVTPYDAAYVALAESLDCPMITCDSRLVNAGGPRCDFELIS